MNTTKTNTGKPGGARLVWVVVAVFVLQLTVWAAWITFASKHRVEEVPLATAP